MPRRVVEADEIAERRRAVVVDENVEAAVMRGGHGHDRGAIFGAAAIGRQRQRFEAGLGADFLGSFVQGLFAARGDGELDAFGRQRPRNAEADALARAADDGDLVLEFQVHDSPSV